MPVQFRGLRISPTGRPPPVPGGTRDNYVKTGQGVIDLWNSFWAGRERPSSETTPEVADEEPPAWLKMTPIAPILGAIVSEMARRGRETDQSGVPAVESPSIVSSEDPEPDDTGCDEEWKSAREFCKNELAKDFPNLGITGGHTTIDGCAKGFVSERCGGNKVDWVAKKKPRGSSKR